MEFEPGAESGRHSVVRITKAIRRAVRLLIIGEEDSSSSEQLPKPERPRRIERPDFVARGIQGEHPQQYLDAFYNDEIYQRAIKQQPRRRR